VSASLEKSQGFLTDNQSLWGYMTSDIAGGRICVVAAEGDLSSLSCDHRAMGKATTIAASIVISK
jgi:hypothetical protein